MVQSTVSGKNRKPKIIKEGILLAEEEGRKKKKKLGAVS